MWLHILHYVLFGLIGVVLHSGGILFNMWQFWASIILLILLALTNYALGMEDIMKQLERK